MNYYISTKLETTCEIKNFKVPTVLKKYESILFSIYK